MKNLTRKCSWRFSHSQCGRCVELTWSKTLSGLLSRLSWCDELDARLISMRGVDGVRTPKVDCIAAGVVVVAVAVAVVVTVAAAADVGDAAEAIVVAAVDICDGRVGVWCSRISGRRLSVDEEAIDSI